MTPRLTLICPTIDRTSVKMVVDIVAPQLRRGDEFIVVGDGPCPRARKWVKEAPPHRGRIWYFELPERVGDYGCTPCDAAIKRAKGDYIFLTGDDDLPDESAFDTIRRGVGFDDPKARRLHIFGMYHGGVGYLRGTVDPGFVSGQQIVFPNDPEKTVKMAEVDESLGGERYSDWGFIMRMVNEYGGLVTFHDEVINYLPTQNLGRMY